MIRNKLNKLLITGEPVEVNKHTHTHTHTGMHVAMCGVYTILGIKAISSQIKVGNKPYTPGNNFTNKPSKRVVCRNIKTRAPLKGVEGG